jgi:Reverse transcriptase (RNA-dependent DNA polymerase).
MPSPSFYSALARSIVAGDPAFRSTVERASHALGRNWRWLGPLTRRYLKAFSANPVPRRKEVIAFLRSDEGLRDAIAHYGPQVRITNWITQLRSMQPISAARTWNVPAIRSVGALATWLDIEQSELEWFANLKGLPTRGAGSDGCNPLSHYHYRVLPKLSGGIRLIESPKRKLKAVQAKILEEILNRIPVHEAAHGFRRGCSIKTFAAPHVNRAVVVRMDLRNFFPSLIRARVQAIFRIAGYPEPVADLLGALCTNAVPRSVFAQTGLPFSLNEQFAAWQIYSDPHLPQGAPTSPSLSNLCAFRLDCRLAGLARSAGATYTRYADDLAFSGDERFAQCAERFAVHAAAIVQQEAFKVHPRKTRIMRCGVRQHLAGLVVNRHLNISRRDFDTLKATLTNCVRNGPENQNREAHPAFQLNLSGRVGFVEMVNPAKGEKLRKIYEQIRW